MHMIGRWRGPVAVIAAAWGAALTAAAALAAPPDAAAAAPRCTTPPVSTATSGRVCGLALTVVDEGRTAAVDTYQGIRYGHAERWTPPAAPPAPTGLTRETAFGPVCPQAPVKGVVQSENCLFLNLWTPTRSSVKRLPVMVFIHGGSFVDGAGDMPVYDGARLAARGEAVIVTLNYRLGALGFLAGGKGVNHLAGNYGVQDQQLALQWVHHNIGRFGGDRTQVTIFGESAGAMSVGAHLVAPASRPLFKNAIMESNPYGVPFKTPAQAADIRTEFDQAKDVAACNGRLACLRRLPAATIVTAQGKVAPTGNVLQGAFSEILAWSPTVDGTLISGQPNQAAIVRPVIAGTNRDEGTLFVGEAFPKGLSDTEYSGLVAVIFKGEAPFILLNSRYKPDGKGNLNPLSNIVGDYFFSCATRHVLGNAKGATFGYAFMHPPSYAVWPQAPAACRPGSGPDRGKVCHSFELPFVFRNPVTVSLPPVQHKFTSGEQAMTDAITSYWTGFAAGGDPNDGAGGAARLARLRQRPALRQVLESEDLANHRFHAQLPAVGQHRL